MPDHEQLIRLNALREELAAVKRLKELRQGFGLNFYVPHSKQHLFHISPATGRYCRCGNRGGKTKCGAAEDVAYCIGGRTWYAKSFDILDGDRQVVERHVGDPEHPYITLGIPQRPVKLLLLVTDWDKSKEIFTNNEGSYDTWGDLFQLIPRNSIAHVNKSRGGHIDRIDIKRDLQFGGDISSIYIDTVESYKHNKMSAESSDWDGIHVDEPCPRSMFTAHSRGLMDRKGRFWFNCTPLDQPWVNDEFCPPNMMSVEHAKDGLSFIKNEEKQIGTRFMITWSSTDNPHNDKDAIAEFESTLSPEEIECRIHGRPLAMAGLVYKEFLWHEHVLQEVPKGWEDYHLPPVDYTYRVWWDTHIRLPQALLFFATAPDGTVYIYDELFNENLIGPNAKALLEKQVGRNFVSWEIDPMALVDNPVDGTNIQDTLMDYGLFFNPATKDRTRGTLMVKEKLRQRGHNKKPTIFISPRCRAFLREITHYVYNPDTNKPVDKDDHMMENLYRAVLSGLEYITPMTEEDYSRRHKLVIGHNEVRNHTRSNLSL